MTADPSDAGISDTGIFVPDGDLLIPQPTACGPWFPGVQHGGAVVGLIARAVESTPAAGPMMLTRLTVDMSRKVPMAPTRVITEILRDGRRVQSVEARYEVDGEIVARGTAMRVRIDPDVVPEEYAGRAWPEDAAPTLPDATPTMRFSGDRRTDFVENFTMKRTEDERGRSHSWFRIERPLVAGEPTSPIVTAAAVADMIPSAGSVVDFERYLSVNPDLTVHFHRMPEGEWLGNHSLVRVSADGYGQTDAVLVDERGAFGRSIKSLLIDRR